MFRKRNFFVVTETTECNECEQASERSNRKKKDAASSSHIYLAFLAFTAVVISMDQFRYPTSMVAHALKHSHTARLPTIGTIRGAGSSPGALTIRNGLSQQGLDILRSENLQVDCWSSDTLSTRSGKSSLPMVARLSDVDSVSVDGRIRKSSDYGTRLENCHALVLNADYTPISQAPLSLWAWQDTLRAVFNEKAVVVSEYDMLIRSVSCSFKLPSVIALRQYYRKPEGAPAMTRKNVFLRDSYCCQYCLEKFEASDLSLDHVVPRARGGFLTWTNTVTACYECNFKKGNVMPEDLPKLGMRLRSKPRVPSRAEIQSKGRLFRAKTQKLHPHWLDFL